MKNESGWREREFKFFQIEIRIGLFLGAFALSNIPAEFAGMLAIEGFDQRFTERRILRIADDHLRPGQRLKECPMQANGTGQRQCQQKFGQP